MNARYWCDILWIYVVARRVLFFCRVPCDEVVGATSSGVFQLKEVMIESSSGESVTVEHAKGWLIK